MDTESENILRKELLLLQRKVIQIKNIIKKM